MDQQEIEVGDFVQIGKSKLTWKVLMISNMFGAPHCTLISGQTQKMRYLVPLESLTLHTKGKRS